MWWHASDAREPQDENDSRGVEGGPEYRLRWCASRALVHADRYLAHDQVLPGRQNDGLDGVTEPLDRIVFGKVQPARVHDLRIGARGG